MRRFFIGLLFIAPGLAGAQQAVCARSSFVTLHEEPSTKSKVTWKVAKYMPFLRQEQKGDWVRVTDLEGNLHWGLSRDFRADIRCVVVKVKAAKLRAEPRSNAELAPLSTLDLYTPLKRVDDKDKWLLVEDELGNKAWINEVNVWKPTSVVAVRF